MQEKNKRVRRAFKLLLGGKNVKFRINQEFINNFDG